MQPFILKQKSVNSRQGSSLEVQVTWQVTKAGACAQDIRQKSSSWTQAQVKLPLQQDSLDFSSGHSRQQKPHRLTKLGVDEEGITNVTRHSLETALWILAPPPICPVDAPTVFSSDTNRIVAGNDLPARGGSRWASLPRKSVSRCQGEESGWYRGTYRAETQRHR